jgi:hypothetical protein
MVEEKENNAPFPVGTKVRYVDAGGLMAYVGGSPSLRTIINRGDIVEIVKTKVAKDGVAVSVYRITERWKDIPALEFEIRPIDADEWEIVSG